MTKKIAAISLSLLFLLFATASAETRYVIISITQPTDEKIHVMMKTENLFSRDLLDALDGGVEIRYRYRVAIKQARTLWFDRTLRNFDVEKAIQYDGLRRIYLVNAQENGSPLISMEYLQKSEAMEAFATHTVHLSKADTDNSYLIAFAYLKEFSNWFPVRVFVNTFADWEFETANVRINLSKIE
ncbi:DUF4390 domain-containing protein [Chrysiogenes arsenatis]|uniref:DUF4390 domain-containing protein n=1 Tax=Chrysiogenes arsenatis TaxID=309797 RepID=UPI0004016BF8|nr:DUF4390 domain-containing protein [Chrysiogenes arsenatis]